MEKIINFYYLAKQIVKEQLFFALSDLFVKIYLVIAFLLNILIWVGAKYIVATIGADQIALHYSVGFGIDYYGDAGRIYIIPLLGLLFIFMNFILYIIVDKYKDKNFIAHILFSSTVVTNTILLMAMLSIYIINF